jgi:hypothetical protein
MSRLHLPVGRHLFVMFSIFAWAVLPIWQPAFGAGIGEPQLTSIPIYPYPGLTREVSERSSFLRAILRDKLRMLGYRFKGLPEGEYLERLSVSEILTEGPSNTAEVRRLLVDDSALEVMYGIIVQRPDGFYWALDHVFVGELGTMFDYLGSEELSFELRLSEDEYGSIADGHSLVTLYALAIDAKRLNMPRAHVVKLLSEAVDVFADIERHAKFSHHLDGDARRTRDAVDKALRRPR